jgi:hypothetical protein
MDKLKELFPTEIHRYRLIENEQGFILDASQPILAYILVFLATVALVYISTYLSFFYNKKEGSVELTHSWLLGRGLLWLLIVFWCSMSLGLFHVMFSNDIPKLNFNMKEKFVNVHRPFSLRKFSFSEFGNIKLTSKTSTGGSRYSSRNTSYYLTARMSGDKEEFLMELHPRLCYSKKPDKIGAYANQLSAALNHIIETNR